MNIQDIEIKTYLRFQQQSLQQNKLQKKEYSVNNQMEEKPSQTANKIASKIFNQLQQNQLLRFKLRQYESYIDQSKQSYERLIASQQKIIDLLSKQVKSMQEDSQRSKSFYLSDHSLNNGKKNHSVVQQCWKKQYITLVDKIQTYAARMTKLVSQFGYRDQENRRLIQIANNQLQRSYKLYRKSQKLKQKTLRYFQGNIQQAQKLIEHLVAKNEQLADISCSKNKEMKKINAVIIEKDKNIYQIKGQLQEAYEQNDELRQQIMLVIQGNQKLKEDLKYFKQRSLQQAKRITYLQKKILYYEGLQEVRKKQKAITKDFQIQTQNFIDQNQIQMRNCIDNLKQTLEAMSYQKKSLLLQIQQNQKKQAYTILIQTQQKDELMNIYIKQKQQFGRKLKDLYQEKQLLKAKNQLNNQILKSQAQQEKHQTNILNQLQKLHQQNSDLNKKYEQAQNAERQAQKITQIKVSKLNQLSQQIKKLEDIKSWKNQQVNRENQSLKQKILLLEGQVAQKEEKVSMLQELLYTQFQQMKIKKSEKNIPSSLQTQNVNEKIEKKKQALNQRSIVSLMSLANNRNRLSQTLKVSSSPSNQSSSFNYENNFFRSKDSETLENLYSSKSKKSFRLDLTGNTQNDYILIKEESHKANKFDLASFKNKMLSGSNFSFYNCCNP